MRIYEIGTGYTSIPADKGAATEIVAENLSRALIDQGHDVTVVDIADENRRPTDLPILEVPMPRGFQGTDEALGVRHKLKRVVYSLALSKVLKRELRSVPNGERVVLHFHNQYNAFFFFKTVPAKLRSRAFVCYTNHSGVWNGPWPDIESVIRKRYFQEIEAQRQSDLVFVLNEGTARNLDMHTDVDGSRVILTANGVDTETYRPRGDCSRDALCRKLSPACTRFVFQCGSICPNKGQLDAMQMLAPFLHQDEGLHYVYAGGIVDSAYATQIETFCQTNGLESRVHYLGELEPGETLSLWYSAAECLVFPSKYEGFSLAVLESLSSGTPVLQSGNARVAAFVSEKEGLLTFYNEEDFHEKMHRLLYGDASRAASSSARACAVSRFSWNVIAKSQANEMSLRLGEGLINGNRICQKEVRQWKD